MSILGVIVAIVMILAALWYLWFIDVPEKNSECTEFDYEEEASKYDDLKSGKFTEYEG